MKIKKPLPWRWRLASVLNRSRKWCWSSLVCWVVYDHPVRELTDARDVRVCIPSAPDTIRNGSCSCSKFKAGES